MTSADTLDILVSQVETLLEQLDSKFDDMSKQILERSMCFRCFLYV